MIPEFQRVRAIYQFTRTGRTNKEPFLFCVDITLHQMNASSVHLFPFIFLLILLLTAIHLTCWSYDFASAVRRFREAKPEIGDGEIQRAPSANSTLGIERAIKSRVRNGNGDRERLVLLHELSIMPS